MHSDGNTGGRMKKWVVFYGVPLALWTWIAWPHLHGALYKAIAPPPSAGPGYVPPWWGSDLAVAAYPGLFLDVVLLTGGVIKGPLRFDRARLAQAPSFLLGCGAAWLGLALPSAAVFCEVGIGLAVVAYLLAVPALVLMVLLTPAKVGEGPGVGSFYG